MHSSLPSEAAEPVRARAPPPGGGGGGGAAVDIRDVRRVYPERRSGAERAALDGVSLRIDSGERVALLGPNGSGKSTLLRLVAMQDAPTAGRVALFGEVLAEAAAPRLRALRRRCAVVFQSPGLDRLLTVRENLQTQAALYGFTGREAEARIERWARRLGVETRLDDRVGTLSGGLVRRADLARALLHDPELLLLDEPTVGLDPRARAEFLAALQEAVAEAASPSPLTIVMSTHLMEEAETADRVVLLNEGRIVAEGSPAALRSELGDSIIRVPARCAATAIETLKTTPAASVESTSGGALLVRAEPPAVGGIAAALVDGGVAFEVGPPTLADVYLARTGDALDAGAEERADTNGGQRSRRSRRSHR